MQSFHLTKIQRKHTQTKETLMHDWQHITTSPININGSFSIFITFVDPLGLLSYNDQKKKKLPKSGKWLLSLTLAIGTCQINWLGSVMCDKWPAFICSSMTNTSSSRLYRNCSFNGRHTDGILMWNCHKIIFSRGSILHIILFFHYYTT